MQKGWNPCEEVEKASKETEKLRRGSMAGKGRVGVFFFPSILSSQLPSLNTYLPSFPAGHTVWEERKLPLWVELVALPQGGVSALR